MRHLDLWSWTEIGQGLIRRAKFDAVRSTLTVVLSNGHVYDFVQVPQHLADKLVNAEHPDQVYVSEIQPHYEYRLMSQTRGKDS